MNIIGVDILGAGLSLYATFLLAQNKYHGWIFNIFACVMNIMLDMQIQLYGQGILECYFLLASSYGLWAWKDKLDSTMRKLSLLGWGLSVSSIVGLTYFAQPILSSLNESAYSLVDATAASIAVVAQYLLMQKYAQTWLFWIVADIMIAILYASQHAYAHAVLYSLYLGIACFAYSAWTSAEKDLNSQSATS